MILGILQARMSSSRLPGKVLKPILGKPMLELQLQRLNRCKSIDKLIIATSDHNTDDPIEELCKVLNFSCFRGSLNNVLDRFVQAGLKYGADHIVRLTADCPLADPQIIDELVQFYLASDADYAANCFERMLPRGLDAEVVSMNAIQRSLKETNNVFDREHVTPYIKKNPHKFKLVSLTYEEDLSHLRWTVDYRKDLTFVREVYRRLYKYNKNFSFRDVLTLLEDNPTLNHTEIDIHEQYYG